MTWVQGSKENNCIDYCTSNQHLLWSVFSFMSWLLCWWKRVLWSVWGPPSWVACSHSAQHPSHVGGMHPRCTLVYHFFIIQAKCIWLLLMCHSMKTLLFIILDHPVDYGLYRKWGPTSIGLDGLFVVPLLNALIGVLINLMCKTNFNCNVTEYFLLNTTMVVTGSGTVVLSIWLRKIL